MNLNKDEVKMDNSSPQAQAQSIVAQAQAQAKKIIQNANIQAKQIVAQARAETGYDEESSVNSTAGKTWGYNKAGESQIFDKGAIPEGWYDSPVAAQEAEEDSGFSADEIEKVAREAYMIERKESVEKLPSWSQLKKEVKGLKVKRASELMDNPGAAEGNDFDIAVIKELENPAS